MTYDPADDSRKSYEFGLAAWREAMIRAGKLPPTNPTEMKWAADGECRPSQYETAIQGGQHGSLR